MEELKPCPFCGGKAITDKHFDAANTWAAFCRSCGAQKGWYGSEDRAIEAWNIRA